jgi:copper transport protein
VLLTFSLQSHGAALGSPLAVVSGWLHLAAMSAWIGGLLPLVLLLRRLSPPLSILVPRFSTVALASVATLVLTGTYAAVIHIRTLDALAATTYGRALAVKIGFFVFLLALGAANLFVISPRLADLRTRAAQWLGRTVRVELLLGLLVLLAAALMTATPPALEALQAQRRQGLVGSVREGDVQVKLRVVPGIIGVNEFGIDVAGILQDAGEPNPEVLLRLKMLDAAMGVTQVETQLQEGFRYTARGSYFSMPGQWQVEVILRRAGMDDIRHTFDVQVKPVEQDAGLPNPIPANAASISAGEALYQSNCLACHGSEGKGDGPVGLTLNPRPADLTQHTMPGVHPDSQLFEWISKGYPGSVMPAFEETLPEEDRWHLVNYIRTLAIEGEP